MNDSKFLPPKLLSSYRALQLPIISELSVLGIVLMHASLAGAKTLERMTLQIM